MLAEWLAGEAYAQALARKKPKTDHQFIRSLYQDLLGRAPGYDELRNMRNMRNALQSMADPAPLRAVMAKVILDSKQAQVPSCEAGKEEEFVRECFLRYLGRHPGQVEGPESCAAGRRARCRRGTWCARSWGRSSTRRIEPTWLAGLL